MRYAIASIEYLVDPGYRGHKLYMYSDRSFYVDTLYEVELDAPRVSEDVSVMESWYLVTKLPIVVNESRRWRLHQILKF